eukprot:scaffold283412_cov21-Tisochrysis_lutea.AAC.1
MGLCFFVERVRLLGVSSSGAFFVGIARQVSSNVEGVSKQDVKGVPSFWDTSGEGGEQFVGLGCVQHEVLRCPGCMGALCA